MKTSPLRVMFFDECCSKIQERVVARGAFDE